MIKRHLRRLCLAIALFAVVGTNLHSAGELQHFTLTEHLDNEWSNELVSFPLNAASAQSDQGELTLLAADGKELRFQIGRTKAGKNISFLVDLAAGKSNQYRLVRRRRAKVPANALECIEDATAIRMSNGLTGIEAPGAKGRFADGPISALRLRSGNWVGSSRLVSKRKISSYASKLVARGPVYAEIECSYVFVGGKKWTLRFRLIAGEPVILIDEAFNLADGSVWEFVVTRDFPADAFAFRNTSLKTPGRKHNGSTVIQTDPKKPGRILVLDPWLQWWGAQHVSFFGIFKAPRGVKYEYSREGKGPVQAIPPKLKDELTARDLEAEKDVDDEELTLEDTSIPLTTRQHRRNRGDVFFAAAGNSSAWAAANKRDGPGKSVPLMTGADGEVFLRAQLNGPGRKWIFGASTVSDTVKTDAQVAEPQRYFIKHCITPLAEVLAMTLEWDQGKAALKHPWIFIDKKDLARAKERFPDTAKWASPTKKLYWNFIQHPTAKLKAKMKAKVIASLRDHVQNFTRSKSWRGGITPSPHKGTVHFCESLLALLFEVDIAFGQDLFSAAERKRVRAQLAFLTHKVGHPDYYDLGRDFRANPNMTTMRHTAVGMYGCMLQDHPKAKEWYKIGWAEIDRELNSFAGPNGGWIECPHYQTLSHVMILFQNAAYKAGLCKEPYDKRVLKSVMYMAKISTPRDKSFHGLRHFPAVGDTPRYELSMIYSIMAKALRNKQPQAANALQWTWYEQGKPLVMAIGGDCIANYFPEFIVADFKPKGPPKWRSELFPLGAAVLRSGFPSDRETQMHLYGGMKWSHYSRDNGSFTLYGKGQPLVLDWGYKGIKPAWWHSKMNLTGMGYFKDFSAQADIDYVRFEYKRKNTWQRQALFVKDQDPKGPNYFLMRDFVEGKGKKDEWYLWLYTKAVPMADGNVAHVTGRGDVDLDLWFAAKWLDQMTRIDAEEAAFVNNPGKGPQELMGLSKDSDDDEDLGLEDEDEKELSPFLKTKPHSYGNATGVLRNIDAPICYRYTASTPGLAQKRITLNVTRGKPLLWLLYPRMRTQKPATFTDLDGKGVKVVSAGRTDYAFLAHKPVQYNKGKVAFKGIAGAIIVTDHKVTLSLAAAGMIRYGKKVLTSDKASTKDFPR